MVQAALEILNLVPESRFIYSLPQENFTFFDSNKHGTQDEDCVVLFTVSTNFVPTCNVQS